jgi:hypothetical protein
MLRSAGVGTCPSTRAVMVSAVESKTVTSPAVPPGEFSPELQATIEKINRARRKELLL